MLLIFETRSLKSKIENFIEFFIVGDSAFVRKTVMYILKLRFSENHDFSFGVHYDGMPTLHQLCPFYKTKSE